MDRVQHNGGTAGIVAGVLLALLFVIILSLGMDVMAPDDPVKSLGAVTQRWSRWVLASVIGLLVSGIAVPFTVGIATRLRDAAPTRARTVLYVTLIGLGGFAAGSVVMWLGGGQVVAYAAKDQAAAAQAWLTLSAVNSGFSGLGGAFTGAGTLIAGWAIISTGVMGSGVGWVGIIAGALNILGLFAPTNPLFFFGGFLSTIVWLLWAGTELRRAKPST